MLSLRMPNVPASREENAVINAPTLLCKRKRSPALDSMERAFFNAMRPTLKFNEEGRDTKFSYSILNDTATRAGGLAAVWEKNMCLSDLSVAWTEVKKLVTITTQAFNNLQDQQQAILDFNLKQEFEWKNTTNVNMYVYINEFKARRELADGDSLISCWENDVLNKVGYSTRYGLSLFGADENMDQDSILSVANFLMSPIGGKVRTNWGKGSGWQKACVPPGGVIRKTMIYADHLSGAEYERMVVEGGTIWKKGMPAFVVKVVGEEIYNNETVSEVVGEVANQGDIGAGVVQATTAPVQMAEVVRTSAWFRYTPGYAKNTFVINSDVAAGSGQIGILPNLSYAKAQLFYRINGDGNGLNQFADIGSVTTLEPVSEDRKGGAEGSVLIKNET